MKMLKEKLRIDYLQKSKIFLLPLTDIKKDSYFKVSNTYISSDDLMNEKYPHGIKPEDTILIVAYPKNLRDTSERIFNMAKQKHRDFKDDQNAWQVFETENLVSNAMYLDYHETSTEMIYTFDLTPWGSDWSSFLNGCYSKLSYEAKEKIVDYRSEQLDRIGKLKLLGYLYPHKEEALSLFSRDLEIDIEVLRGIGELCDKPDLQKENYKWH